MKKRWALLAPFLILFVVLIGCEKSTTQSARQVSIRWLDYDGSLLSSDTVEEGTLPVFWMVPPTRPYSGGYSYSFSGWTPEVVPAMEHADYYAVYTATLDLFEYAYLNGENAYEISGLKTYDFTDIVIPSTYEGKPVKSIGERAFAEYPIESVAIPDSIARIGKEAFAGCYLVHVQLSENITHIGDGAFSRNHSLESITVDPDNPYFSGVDGVLYTKSKSGLLVYPTEKEGSTFVMPNTVTWIEDGAFSRQRNLVSVTLSPNLERIGDQAFMYCYGITSMSLPNKLEKIGSEAFLMMEKWEGSPIPSGVTEIGSKAFLFCESISSVSIPAGVTTIGEGAFSGCESLTNISVDSNNLEYVSLNGVLYEKPSSGINAFHPTKIISYPAAKTGTSISLPSSVTKIGDYAFVECEALQSISITGGLTQIGDYAFGGCGSLNGFVIPESVISLGEGVFEGCSSLTTIVIPESITTVKDNLFAGCTQLQSITIHDGITRIGKHAFDYCTSLVTIDLPAELLLIDESAFQDCKSLITIQIPSGTTEIGFRAFYGCEDLEMAIIPDSVAVIDLQVFDGSPELAIYCQSQQKPEGWSYAWCPEEYPVVWGHILS